MKKIIVFFLFVIGAFALFTLNFENRFGRPPLPESFYDGFSTLDRSAWYVGEWGTHEAGFAKVFIEDGLLKIPVNETDKGPYVLSAPMEIKDNEVIRVKRRVKVHPGSDYFAGGMVLFETPSDKMRPDPTSAMPFGNGLILVEYAKDLLEQNTRPGDENIRLLAPNWEAAGNYLLIDPIFDEWFTEELEFNLLTGKAVYTLNGKQYQINCLPAKQPYIRLWMHSFGHFTGHEVDVDFVEIKWLPKGELEDETSGNITP